MWARRTGRLGLCAKLCLMREPQALSEQCGADSANPVGSDSLTQVAVLIPVWQPQDVLLSLVAELSRLGFGCILVVDDGSSGASRRIFTKLCAFPSVETLHHPVNRGKGRALKTGFSHLLKAYPELIGVVTADADGQHAANDIGRVARALLAGGGRPVLGARRFDGRVPRFSRIGNQVTRKIFGLVTGAWLLDTQTGLRGLPSGILPALLSLPGERYEYETVMLARLCRSTQSPIEVPIETIYLDRNSSSHFHPVWDSWRIYFVLLRLCLQRLLPGGRRHSV